MSNLLEEKNEKMEDEEEKQALKKINVDGIAKLLIKIQDENQKIKSEHVDMKQMISEVTQNLSALHDEIVELKALGNRGILGGTGSTVHYKDEEI